MRQGHLAALLAAAAALTLPAVAQTPPIQPAPGMLVTGSNATVTPNGATSASVLSALTGHVLTPYDFGGLGDTQRNNSCTVTTASGSPTVTVTGCTFTAADIGKAIVIHGAGPSLTTAPIASAAVNAAGSAYTTIPTITVTDATGAGALLTANEGLLTATVVSGGGTCTNGAQTFTVDGGTNTTPAQFTGTVTGGVLGGALTVTVAGSYSVLPSVTAATVSGGGCGTKPTISNTWKQVTPTLVFSGSNYTAPTAAYSAGNATLNNPTLATAGIQPLASTISNVVGTTLTLSSNAGQTITTTAKKVVWGHDDSAAINAMIVATTQGGKNGFASSATGNYSVCGFLPPAKSGMWGIASPIVLNPGGLASCLRGGGQFSSTVVALASMANVVNTPTGTFVWGGSAADVGFDGNLLATNTALFNCAAGFKLDHMRFANAASQNGATTTSNLVLGDGVTSGCNTVKVNFPWFDNELASGYADQSTYLINVVESDALINSPTGTGANVAEIIVNAAAPNTMITNPHLWGNAGGYPQTTYLLNGSTSLINPIVDGINQYGIQVNHNDSVVIGGLVELVGSATHTIGLKIAPSLNNITVTGFNAAAISTIANRIVNNTTIGNGVNVNVIANPGAGFAVPVLAGDLTVGGNFKAGADGTNRSHSFLTANTADLLVYSDTASQVTLEATNASNTNTKYDLALNKYGGNVIVASTSATETLHGNILLPEVTTGTNTAFVCMSSGNKLTLQTSACTISSMRFKNLIGDYKAGGALDTIKHLEPIVFTMKPGETPNPDTNYTNPQIGLSAENVAAIEPRCAIYEDDGMTPKSYRQECLIAVLVAGMQAQQREIEALRAR